jgi:hypothetical protein
MMKHRYLISFLILFTGKSLDAQTKIGIGSGYSTSNQTISNPSAASIRAFDSWAVESKSTQLSGLNITLEIDHQINSKWNFKTGIGYIQKGQVEEIINKEPSGRLYTAATYTDKINYVNIPAKFNYSIFKNHNLSISLSGGLYLGFGVSGKTTHEIFGHRYSSFYTPPQEYAGKVFFESSISSRNNIGTEDIVVKPIDFGLVTGVGLAIKRFELFVDYQLGLNDVHAKIDNVRPSSNDSLHNERIKNNRSLILGIRFWIVTLK